MPQSERRTTRSDLLDLQYKILLGGLAFFFAVGSLPDSLLLPRASAAVREDAPAEDVASQLEQLWDEAQAAIGLGKYDSAVELLNQYVVLDAGSPRGKLELARVYSWQGKMDESIAQFDLYLAAQPYDLDVAVEKAQVLSWTGALPEAEQALRKVLQLEPENLPANRLLADILDMEGRTEEAGKVREWLARLESSTGTIPPRRGGSATEGEPAATATPQGPGGPAASVSLEWLVSHSADNQNYTYFGTSLGPRFGLGPVELKPYGKAAYLTARDFSWVLGAGGGLEAGFQILENLRVAGWGEALVYPDAGDALDLGGQLSLEASILPSLWVAVRGGTALYGIDGQSLATLEGGVRHWGGEGMLNFSRGIFSVFALGNLKALVMDPYPTSLVSTAMIHPRLKLAGEEHQFRAGYKAWYTGHSQPAPTDYGYWSPAQYLTNQLTLSLEGPVGRSGSYNLDMGGGLGQEYEPTTDFGTEFEKEGFWSFFPSFSAGAGIRGEIAAGLETGIGAWAVFSRRSSFGRLSQYLLWNVDFHLMYRW